MTSWQAIRLQTLERDKGICQLCLEYENLNTMEVHHIISRKKHGLNILENLMSVCHKCHRLLESTKHLPVKPRECIAISMDIRLKLNKIGKRGESFDAHDKEML